MQVVVRDPRRVQRSHRAAQLLEHVRTGVEGDLAQRLAGNELDAQREATDRAQQRRRMAPAAQAVERAGAKAGNRGADAAMVAVEMADLYARIEAEKKAEAAPPISVVPTPATDLPRRK